MPSPLPSLATPSSSAPPRSAAFLLIAGLLWMITVFLRVLSRNSFVDLDLFHELALARFFFEHQLLPLHDPFSYTSSVPFIHHEWGTGLLLYPVVMVAGSTGLVFLKFLLVAAILLLCLRLARQRLAPWVLLIPGTILAAFLGLVSFPTLRAQFFTLLFMAILLNLLNHDRPRKHAWILAWIPLALLWQNLHGGFVVGIGILALHTLEQSLRTRHLPKHLLAALLASILLTGLTPYGYALPRSILAAIALPRPDITEWQPLWHSPTPFIAFLIALLLLAYALHHLRLKNSPGLPILLVTAILALLHTRHASLFAIAWLAYVPAYLAQSPIASFLHSFALRRAKILAPIILLLATFTFLASLQPPFWQLQIPTRPDSNSFDLAYPVGPAHYLQDLHFTGNLMTPYNDGSYITWKLFPSVKVALDSRYEVAYPPELASEIADFYRAAPTWRQTLLRYPTDLVLARNDSPLIKLLPLEAHWPRIYQDPTFSLFARPALNLPPTSQITAPRSPTFP